MPSKDLKNRIILGVMVGILYLSNANSVFAQLPGEPNPPPSGGNGGGLDNPIRFDSIPALLAQLLDLVVMIGVPIAILFLVYSGFLFVTARGSEDKLKKAKHILLYTVVGTALIVGAALIAEVIEGTVDQLQGN